MRALSIAVLLAVGCTTEVAEDPSLAGLGEKPEEGKADSSAVAVFLDFEFEGELRTDYAWNPESTIENQLFYTIGHLNGDRGVGRLDRVELTNIETTNEGGETVIRYTAKLPVAWGQRTNVPTEYRFRLPRDVRSTALESFATKYGHSCVDFGAHDVDAGSMWYYYRPNRSGCSLAEGDFIETVARVTPSPIQTTGKFPEYDLVWDDDALEVVAIFGKYEDGATTSADAGIAGYNSFLRGIRQTLGAGVTTVPATLPNDPGTSVPEAQFSTTLADGRTVRVVAILVDNVRTAGAAFDARYAELTPTADLIFYNGHAGLGSNTRALARKGRWMAGKYAIVFMNGCDTYTYIDNALWDAHAAVNTDDPEGTKYMDIVTNAMPSFFRSMPAATLALINGLMSYAEPRTYEQIFRNVDTSQVVLVTGEHDNAFVPGGGGMPMEWAGLTASGTVTRGQEMRWETPALAAGSYVFQMTGTSDADLYVRVGMAPTLQTYDCRPYLGGSRESCRVSITSPAPVHVMIRGYAASSNYSLEGKRE